MKILILNSGRLQISRHISLVGTYPSAREVSIKLNVIEKGKETVSNAGQTSTVFYELDFRKNAKGKMELVKP